MYLLKPRGFPLYSQYVPYLHSTMYLLKRIHHQYQIIQFYDLHSTMYLLKLLYQLLLHCYFLHLHSTMYLLKHLQSNLLVNYIRDLHSTMYLLKQNFTNENLNSSVKFTFHYVSIKTYRNNHKVYL